MNGRGVAFAADIFHRVRYLDEGHLPHYCAHHDFYFRCRNAMLHGVLGANHHFGLVNVVRVPIGIFTVLGFVEVLIITSILSRRTCTVFCLHTKLTLGRSVCMLRAIVGLLINFRELDDGDELGRALAGQSVPIYYR